MKYKCVFIDLDDTLLATDKSISSITIKTLKDLIKKGIEFVPTTGRAFYSIPEGIISLKGIKYAITSNGAAVYDIRNKMPLIRAGLPEDFTQLILDLFTDDEIMMECFMNGRPFMQRNNYEDSSLFGGDSIKLKYIRETRTPVENIKSFAIEHKKELDGLNIVVKKKSKKEVETIIKNNYPNVYITSSQPYLLEISNKECGKHQGMRKLCEYLGLDKSQVIAFGDNNNDIEMLNEAGLGIAVKNATKECLRAADMLTLSNDENGVAYKLKEIFNI